MGAIMQKKISKDVTLGIWEYEEGNSENMGVGLKNKSDLVVYGKLKNAKLKRQFVGTRLLLQEMIPECNLIELKKNKNGKPHLLGAGYNVSISHSGNYVAVLLSQISEIGVDIELIGEKAVRIRNRFMSDFEVQKYEEMKPSKRNSFAHLIWGAKESLYKLYSKGNVSFKDNLILTPFDLQDEGTLMGNVKLGAVDINCELCYFKVNEYMVVCAWKS